MCLFSLVGVCVFFFNIQCHVPVFEDVVAVLLPFFPYEANLSCFFVFFVVVVVVVLAITFSTQRNAKGELDISFKLEI
jgi:hypothetical protein